MSIENGRMESLHRWVDSLRAVAFDGSAPINMRQEAVAQLDALASLAEDELKCWPELGKLLDYESEHPHLDVVSPARSSSPAASGRPVRGFHTEGPLRLAADSSLSRERRSELARANAKVGGFEVIRHSADDGRLVIAIVPIAKVRTVSFGGRTLPRVDPNQFHLTLDAATLASMNSYCSLLQEPLMVEHIDGRIATVRFPESGT